MVLVEKLMRKQSTVWHISFSVLLLIAILVFFESTNTDIYVQNLFYNNAEHRWLINRENLVYRFLFYNGIKAVLVLGVVVALMVLLVSFLKPALAVNRRRLSAFILSATVIPSVVGFLKNITNMPCPKELTLYTGDTLYYHLFQFIGRPDGHHMCFPAGHASGGFAMLGLVFLAKTRRKKQLAIYGSLVLGMTMGLYKMAIGDHFLSHTLVSLVLSWLLVTVIGALCFRQKL